MDDVVATTLLTGPARVSGACFLRAVRCLWSHNLNQETARKRVAADSARGLPSEDEAKTKPLLPKGNAVWRGSAEDLTFFSG